jgi:hypothetical protein
MHKIIEIPRDIEVPETSLWAKLPIIGLVLGVIGLGPLMLMYGSDKINVQFGYLFAFIYWLTIALGAMIIVMIQHVVRSGWVIVVRRIVENMMMTIFVFAALFIPIAIFSHDIYPWMHEADLDAILLKKVPYLNDTFFYVRAVLYFVLWIFFAAALYLKSTSQDNQAGGDSATRFLWKVGTIGLPVYALSQSFAGFDWVMSLQPHWYSTIFGVYFFAGSILAAWSMLALVCMGLQRAGMLKSAITTEHYHDIGKYIFGFTVFWTYIAFSQFFLIWYANIPEETEFFIHRLHHGWGTISWMMPITHFFVPFFFLLSRHVKRSRIGLAVAAVYILFVHLIDIYWLIMPTAGAHGPGEPLHLGEGLLVHGLAWVGIGGFFFAAFGFIMKRNKLLAIGDPRIEESLSHENY